MFVGIFIFLDLCVRGLCCCVTFDCAPRVRLVLYLRHYDHLPEAIAHEHRQYRHLELEQARHSDRDWRVGSQRWVSHSKYVPSSPLLHTIGNPIENMRWY